MKRLVVVLLALVVIEICGSPLEERIAGGKSSKAGKYPYVVYLRKGGHFFCAGSILNQHWVVTAAHCISGVRERIDVVSGAYKLSSGGTAHSVQFLDIFTGYNAQQIIHDIALIKVIQPFHFDANVKPIGLETTFLDAGKSVVMMGWGQTHTNGPTVDKLQYVKLKTIDNLDCSHRLGTQIYTSQICTLTKAGEGMCQGDSGGPLVHDGKLAGVASYGRPCATGQPDVYSRIQYYANWIHDEMRRLGP